MSWRRKVNETLARRAGVQIHRVRRSGAERPGEGRHANGHRVASPAGRPGRRASLFPAGGPRLVPSPVFVLSATLPVGPSVAALFDGHSQVSVQRESDVGRLEVEESSALSARAMREAGFDHEELVHLLWDRALRRGSDANKDHILIENVANVLRWRRLHACWPAARYVFVVHHPMATAASWATAPPEQVDGSATSTIGYLSALDEARRTLPGITVRGEDLASDRAEQLRRICGFLEIRPEKAPVATQPATSTVAEEHRGASAIDESAVAELARLCTAWCYDPDGPTHR